MFQSYAIIPAAGRSVRMGRHKLLLPWGEATIIEHVLAAWQESRVTRVVVVVRPGDERLRELCARSRVEVVVPEVAPSEMRVSVQLGLEYVRQRYAPRDHDAWLLAPADMPGISPRLIDEVLDAYEPSSPSIWLPTWGPQRGHPVVFPWSVASQVSQLAESEGINALLGRHPVRTVECEDPESLKDVDTPEDYGRLRHAP